jgi:ubiquinone biosynthesis monooxygenase Coq7
MKLAARFGPGDSLGNRVLKVNHAGEHGAVNIYRGQILMCRWRASNLVPQLQEFQADEQRHRAVFWEELTRRGRGRCRSYHLCGIGGFVLGAFTGLCGPSAVAATTVAVERVVLRHLAAQMKQLCEPDPRAFDAISSIVHDERIHHDRAELETRQGRFWPRVFMPLVSGATEAVIWLGMKL